MNEFSINQEVKYAGFWLRFIAAILDSLIIGFVQMVIIGPIMAFLGLSTNIFHFAGLNADDFSGEDKVALAVGLLSMFFALSILSTIMSWLYFALMESSAHRATLGKMALGIQVTDMDGNRISFMRATGRYFGKIISGMILAIGYIMAAFTEKKQALHDIIASCLVIRKEN